MILAEHTALGELLTFIKGCWELVKDGGPLAWFVLVAGFILGAIYLWPKSKRSKDE